MSQSLKRFVRILLQLNFNRNSTLILHNINEFIVCTFTRIKQNFSLKAFSSQGLRPFSIIKSDGTLGDRVQKALAKSTAEPKSAKPSSKGLPPKNEGSETNPIKPAVAVNFKVNLDSTEDYSEILRRWDGKKELAFMNIPATGNFGRILSENFKNPLLLEKTNIDLVWLKENHPGAEALTVFRPGFGTQSLTLRTAGDLTNETLIRRKNHC